MEYKNVCKNVWCKGHFIYTDVDIVVIDGKENHPRQCKNCRSYGDELKWEDKTYEGDRFDGQAHQIQYNVTNFKL